MLPVQPQVMTSIPGYDSDKIAIPDVTPIDTATPSIKSLFPPVTSVPLNSGGLPVERTGMNGLFNLFGQFLFLYQSGLFPDYNAQVNYSYGSLVKNAGTIYYGLRDNGPDTSAGVHPTSDTNYWAKFDPTSFVPVGSVHAFAGRNVPAGYLLCDGRAVQRSDYPLLFNVIGTTYGTPSSAAFNLPNLMEGRFIQGDAEPGTYYNAGLPAITHTHTATTASGGAHTHTGSTGGAGNHNHSGTANGGGNHAHGRGTMDIKGRFKTAERWSGGEGAFYPDTYTDGAGGSGSGLIYGFSAARNWSGVTTYSGDHQHGLTINNNGNHTHTVTIDTGGAHSHTLTTLENSSISGLYGASSTVQPKALGLLYVIKY